MRVINPRFIRQAAAGYPKAAKWLKGWLKMVRAVEWKGIEDVRKTYPHADAVKVKSKRIVTVFNVCNDKYRLIVALHYNTQMAFTLRFMTHAEYTKEEWKTQL